MILKVLITCITNDTSNLDFSLENDCQIQPLAKNDLTICGVTSTLLQRKREPKLLLDEVANETFKW